MKALVATFARWDGRDTAVFREVSSRLEPGATAIRRMLAIAARSEFESQVGAMWVIKDLCERGASLTRGATRTLLDRFDTLAANEAILIALQTLQYADLEPSDVPRLRTILNVALTVDHTFIRAWAYNGLAYVAELDPTYREEVLTRFDEADETESASVRARIRQARRRMS